MQTSLLQQHGRLCPSASHRASARPILPSSPGHLRATTAAAASTSAPSAPLVPAPSPSSPSPSPSHATPPEASTAATHAAQPSLTRLPPTSRALAVAAAAVLCGFVAQHDIDPLLRLPVLSYMTWTLGEWLVHRYLMHAKAGSWGDRFSHLNKLHVDHHLDTQKDMRMKEGFDVHALYFHFPNTALQVAISLTSLTALDVALGLDIPLSWAVVASVVSALIHNLLWNSLHTDMHEVQVDATDGVPCLRLPRVGAWYAPYLLWVFNNHTTHHDAGGGTNFNVVVPGADFVFGTYLQRSADVKLQ